MIFDSLKRNGSAILLYSIGIIVLLWSSSFIWNPGQIIQPDTQKSFANLVYKFFNSELISLGMAAVVILSAAMLLYRLNEQHLFISKREQLIPIVFILLSSTFTEFRYISSTHFALIAILLSLDYLFTTYRDDYAYKQIFMSAFFIAIASLFHPPAIFLGLAVIIGVMLLKPTQWRDYVVFLAGLVVPYIFALFYYFFTIGIWNYPFALLNTQLQVTFPLQVPSFSPTGWIFIAYTFLFFISSLFKVLFNPNRGHKVKAKGINSVFMWMYFISLACIVLYPHTYTNGYVMYIMIPTTISFVDYFANTKSNLASNVIFSLLLIFIILVQLPANLYFTIADTSIDIWTSIIDLF